MKLKRFTTQLVAAGLVALPLWAQAAGMGRLSVNSALGQPLTAEIEIFAADQAELESLSANLASDQAFRDARVDFAPVLSTLRFSIERRPGNQAVLKVTSIRPVTDPFIDMLIELNWASGRLVREYTLLLDPPGIAKPQTVAPSVATPAAPVPEPVATPAPAPAPKVDAPTAAPAEKPAKSAAPESVTVKQGDTLSGIASRVRPEGVSLEQTLVGLYRENTEAFNGNINRLKAGKTLNVPSAEQMAAIPQAEAVRELKLQAEDWRAYRQRLAAAAQAAPEATMAPDTAASGRISPKVEDRAKPAPEAQKDVLKLSKVSPPAPANGKAAAEVASLREQIAAQEAKLRAQEEDATAREKALQEANQRVALLEKQVADMQKLVAMKEQALAEAAKPSPVAEPAPEPAPAPEMAAPAAETKPEAKPEPAPAVPAARVPVAPAEPEASWYEPLLANPVYWGGGLAAVGLGGVLWWMMAGRRRKTGSATVPDNSLFPGNESRPISVIGAASGASVNTGDTSFLTDFSQAGLGTIDTNDVDPIAEAEVYMAYGRDAQAEEILKEAIARNPDRHEVRVKLLEIYAARRNTTAFASVAGELYAALGSDSHPLWVKACGMGREIDPTNPLYGGAKDDKAPAAAVAATASIAGGTVVFGSEAEAAKPAAVEPEPETRFDTRVMNFSASETPAVEAPVFEKAPAFEPAPVAEEPVTASMGLDFELSDLDVPAAANDTVKLDPGMEEENGPDSKFDFSGLDLDLGESGGSELELDEVGTKLDLARAYVEMGDKEGAREILNEVLAEGSEKQKADAEGILSALG